MRRSAIVLLLLILPCGALAQQAPPPARDANIKPTFGAASISGTVVNDTDPSQPVRRAIITLTGTGLVPSRGAITDDEGRFTIGSLPAGRFTLTVSRSGFLSSIYGAKRPGRPGTAIAVGDGAKLDNIRVKIWRGAALGGVLRDDNGVPVQGIPVFAIPSRAVPGATPTLSNNGAMTNDLGEFRLFGLEPGTYVVAARPSAGGGGPMSTMSEAEVDAALAALRGRRSTTAAQTDQLPAPATFAYAQIFYPGTALLAQADPITLTAGQEVVGLDFALQRISTAVVEGVVTRPDGLSPSGTEVQLTAVIPTGRFVAGDAFTVRTTAGPEGRFRIPQVTPGQYRLMARAAAQPEPPKPPVGGGQTVFVGTTGPQLWGSTLISMEGSDVVGLVVPLESGASFSGRILFAGTSKPPTNLSGLRAGFNPTEGIDGSGAIRTIAFVSAVPVRADGTFDLVGLPPGRFRFTVFGTSLNNASWVLHSAIAGSRDLLDGLVDIATGAPTSELVVTYSDDAAELSGTLQTAAGAPASDVFVIAFSTDRAAWGAGARRVQAVRPGVDGRYVMKGLPPGEYYLAAVTDVDQDEWQDTTFLSELIPASIKLTITGSEKKVQDLRIGGG